MVAKSGIFAFAIAAGAVVADIFARKIALVAGARAEVAGAGPVEIAVVAAGDIAADAFALSCRSSPPQFSFSCLRNNPLHT